MTQERAEDQARAEALVGDWCGTLLGPSASSNHLRMEGSSMEVTNNDELTAQALDVLKRIDEARAYQGGGDRADAITIVKRLLLPSSQQALREQARRAGQADLPVEERETNP